MKQTLQKIDRAATRLDNAILSTFVGVARPAERRRQLAVLLGRLDRAVIAFIVDAMSPMRRQQAREFAVRAAGVARESYRQVRESLRKPEPPELLALREEASDLVVELGRLITQASRTAEETTGGEWADTLDSLIVELSRWRGIMTLEAAGGPGASDPAVSRLSEQMGSTESMNAGARTLARMYRQRADNRDLTRVERSIMLVVMQSRMTLARIRHQRGEMSSDDLVWELLDARENLSAHVLDDLRPEPFARIRALIDAMPDNPHREDAAA